MVIKPRTLTLDLCKSDRLIASSLHLRREHGSADRGELNYANRLSSTTFESTTMDHYKI